MFLYIYINVFWPWLSKVGRKAKKVGDHLLVKLYNYKSQVIMEIEPNLPIGFCIGLICFFQKYRRRCERQHKMKRSYHAPRSKFSHAIHAINILHEFMYHDLIFAIRVICNFRMVNFYSELLMEWDFSFLYYCTICCSHQACRWCWSFEFQKFMLTQNWCQDFMGSKNFNMSKIL